MAKLGINLPDEAYNELVKEAEARGATLANYVRGIIEEHFKQQGKTVSTRVKWGGYRERTADDDEGQG